MDNLRCSTPELLDRESTLLSLFLQPPQVKHAEALVVGGQLCECPWLDQLEFRPEPNKTPLESY